MALEIQTSFLRCGRCGALMDRGTACEDCRTRPHIHIAPTPTLPASSWQRLGMWGIIRALGLQRGDE
jgi:hypothetical protein